MLFIMWENDDIFLISSWSLFLLPKALEVADVSKKQLASDFGCFRIEKSNDDD